MCSAEEKPALRSVVVYCGSHLGNNDAFIKAAQGIAKQLWMLRDCVFDF
jgi:predicted Rossmann-fold nucleotide-binding protein